MNRPTATLVDRVHQTRRLLRVEGWEGIAQRVRQRLAVKLMPPGSQRLGVSRENFLQVAEMAENGWQLPAPMPWSPTEPLSIAWVCSPPAPGSGGHTTMFRMVAALERAGHTCVVYLQDQHGWSIDQHRETVRSWWPWVRADVRDFADGIDDCHAIFATAWETAYAVLGSEAKGLRCYFVQDFEPAFSPAGSAFLLAEDTYRFGFFGVTAGSWLSDLLRTDYGMEAESFDFGCDLEAYTLERGLSPGQRSGICYYCRPSTPRRAHELAIFALDLFARDHPDVDIHFFGEPSGPMPFNVIEHGLLSPEDLGRLYNRCVGGLVLSATNVSLVPLEMLSAGCIPIVNDAEQNRMVLNNPHVVYALATPFALAKALADLVDQTPQQKKCSSEAAAQSVESTPWSAPEQEFVRIVRNAVASRV